MSFGSARAKNAIDADPGNPASPVNTPDTPRPRSRLSAMTSVVVDGPGLFSDADYAMATSARGENHQFGENHQSVVLEAARSICS